MESAISSCAISARPRSASRSRAAGRRAGSARPTGAAPAARPPLDWLAGGARRPTPSPRRSGDDDGPPEEPKRVAWVGDLDGDGHAEIVTREGLDTKSGMKQAKKPRMRYAIHKLRPDL